MRFFSSLLVVVLFSTYAHAQNPPDKVGLWETTVHMGETVSPEIAATMKAQGLPSIPPPTTSHTRSCHYEKESQSLTTLENEFKSLVIASAKLQSCTVLRQTKTAQSLSSTYSCQGPGNHATLEIKITLPSAEQMNTSSHLARTYPGMKGQAVSTVDTSSHLIGADCGSIAPGKSVVIP